MSGAVEKSNERGKKFYVDIRGVYGEVSDSFIELAS